MSERPTHVELFTGARDCSKIEKKSRLFALSVLVSLPPNSIVVVGDAFGFDTFVWTEAQALVTRNPEKSPGAILRYSLDGKCTMYVRQGTRYEKTLDFVWQEPPPSRSPEWKTYPLVRNDWMISVVLTAGAWSPTETSCSVHCTGMLYGPSRGTRYTLDRCTEFGIPSFSWEVPVEDNT